MPKRTRKLFRIGEAAALYQLHPQTLRLYEREGLLSPSRSRGNARYYTDQDLERLEVILSLTRDLGVNLAGIEVILNMRERLAELQEEVRRLKQALSITLANEAGAATAGALIRLPSRTVVRARSRSH